MTDMLFTLQRRMAETLAANAGVQAVLGTPPRVYDHPPQDAPFPYAVFGPLRVDPMDDLIGSGFDAVVTINVWSRYRGGKETREILQALYAALHHADLGDGILSCDFHSADFGLDPDGLTYHAAVRFGAMMRGT